MPAISARAILLTSRYATTLSITPFKYFSAVFFGVLVLTYSLLLGLGRFSVRANEIHKCGLELGRLARKIYGAKNSSIPASDAVYTECANAYYDALNSHENHDRADYYVASYEYYSQLKLVQASTDDWWSYAKAAASRKLELIEMRFKDYALHAFQFFHYVVSLVLIWGWVIYLIWPSFMQRH
jgi:hypothetical protein